MEKLKIFVKKCDVIINCIAPAYIYSNKIARIVGETGRIYLDLTDCIASEKLPSGGTYITSCGYIPGISAALPKLIIDKYFDKVDSGIFIQGGYAGGNDQYSFSGKGLLFSHVLVRKG